MSSATWHTKKEIQFLIHVYILVPECGLRIKQRVELSAGSYARASSRREMPIEKRPGQGVRLEAHVRRQAAFMPPGADILSVHWADTRDKTDMRMA